MNDGGLGLVEMLFPTAEKNGIEIIYEAKATALTVDAKGKISGVRVQTGETLFDFPSRAVSWPPAALRPIRKSARATSARDGI